MIQLGVPLVSLYPYNGIRIQNNGKIIFEGDCTLGNSCVISVGNRGVLRFGNKTCATASVKFVCQKSVSIGEKSLFGWETIITDTDFHEIMIDKIIKSKNEAVKIGNNNWFAMQCTVLKGSQTPNGCIFGAKTLLNKDYKTCAENTLFAGIPAKPVRNGVFRVS